MWWPLKKEITALVAVHVIIKTYVKSMFFKKKLIKSGLCVVSFKFDFKLLTNALYKFIKIDNHIKKDVFI